MLAKLCHKTAVVVTEINSFQANCKEPAKLDEFQPKALQYDAYLYGSLVSTHSAAGW